MLNLFQHLTIELVISSGVQRSREICSYRFLRCAAGEKQLAPVEMTILLLDTVNLIAEFKTAKMTRICTLNKIFKTNIK
ncbi:hypothetical protein DBR40_19670 [Pedobacter sp. KBW01]|nr:hypothetical protein DBR40_19670 [Pedobacter sp. KBW01]